MAGLVKNAKEYRQFVEQTSKGGVISFEERIDIRIKKDDRKQIRRIIKADDYELYDSESHFIRCAIRKLIREEYQRLKL